MRGDDHVTGGRTHQRSPIAGVVAKQRLTGSITARQPARGNSATDAPTESIAPAVVACSTWCDPA